MKNAAIILFLNIFFCLSCQSLKQNAPLDKEPDFSKLVQFPSLDSLMISGKLYEVDKKAPYILLCHQARFNKFEYEGIAQELNAKGFNCLAIDQRSGGPIANQVNETTLRAQAAGKGTDYLDAEQDIVAGLNYLYQKQKNPVILWGSSYSSTLVLYVACQYPEKVAAVVSFSPGNYFAEQKGSLIEKLALFKKPLFLTSSKQEAPAVTELMQKTEKSKQQVQFIPQGEGHHGSRALWKNQSGAEEYWSAINSFLSALK